MEALLSVKKRVNIIMKFVIADSCRNKMLARSGSTWALFE